MKLNFSIGKPSGNLNEKIKSALEKGIITINDRGEVFYKNSRQKNKPIGRKTVDGYLKSDIRIDKNRITFYNHRAVAIKFLGLPPDPEMCVNHINWFTMDNRPSNLEWVTTEENNARKKPTEAAIDAWLVQHTMKQIKQRRDAAIAYGVNWDSYNIEGVTYYARQ